jgi:long-chain acyl-CoA synthetase
LAGVIDQTDVRMVVLTEVGDLHPQPKRTLINWVVRYVRRQVPQLHFPDWISFRQVLNQGAALPKPDLPEPETEDIAVLQYTGGTTGGPKGCMLTHGSLISSMHQCTWLYQRAGWEAGRSTLVVPLPLYHIYAFDVGFCHGLMNGHHTLLIPNPRDIKDFVRTLRKSSFEGFTGLNTLFNALMNNTDFASMDFSRARLAIAGGMALSSSVAERWEKLTGVQICEGYGLTESSGILSVNVPGDIRLGTVGVGFSGCEFRIAGENGESLPVEQPGELCFKGAQMMKGYWNNPEETKKILDDDGWMRTGDIAVMGADGRLRIVDRAKDMIVVSGFKVFPNEVEDVLMDHPDIVECAVVAGRTDTGEFVRAFVVSSRASLTAEEVQEFCRSRLTAYKVPKTVEFRDSLPKTNVGKILRKELRDT